MNPGNVTTLFTSRSISASTRLSRDTVLDTTRRSPRFPLHSWPRFDPWEHSMQRQSWISFECAYMARIALIRSYNVPSSWFVSRQFSFPIAGHFPLIVSTYLFIQIEDIYMFFHKSFNGILVGESYFSSEQARGKAFADWWPCYDVAGAPFWQEDDLLYVLPNQASYTGALPPTMITIVSLTTIVLTLAPPFNALTARLTRLSLLIHSN